MDQLALHGGRTARFAPDEATARKMACVTQRDSDHDEADQDTSLTTSRGERFRDAMRAALPAAFSPIDMVVPGAGAGLSFATAAVIDYVWSPAAQRRVTSYLQHHLVPRIDALEDQVHDLVERLNAPIVVDVGMQTVRAAGFTSDDSKHAVLAAAVVTVVADPTWDARGDHALMLTRLVAELTATEVRVLALLADPLGWQQRHHPLAVAPAGDGRFLMSALVLAAFPDLADHPQVVYAALNGLESRQLTSMIGAADPDSSAPSLAALFEPAVSTLGSQLLEFIGAPASW